MCILSPAPLGNCSKRHSSLIQNNMETEPNTVLSALTQIQRKLRAKKDKQNAFGGYSYRNKEGILEAVKPILAEHNASITISEELVNMGDRFYIKATANLHAHGGTVTSTAYAREAATKKGMDEAQITGAASSYAGKYALCNLLAIDDSSVDPDANNDHDKRLPDLAEVVTIAKAETLESLQTTFSTLRRKNVAVGYLTELCKARKEELLKNNTVAKP